MRNKVDIIVNVIYGIVMILPLFYSLFKIFSYLMNKNLKKRRALIFLSIVGIIVSSFLILMIASVFWFQKMIDIPDFLKAIAITLFFLYWLGGFGVLYALGVTSGLAGRSPSNIIRDVMDNFSEKGSTDKRKV